MIDLPIDHLFAEASRREAQAEEDRIEREAEILARFGFSIPDRSVERGLHWIAGVLWFGVAVLIWRALVLL